MVTEETKCRICKGDLEVVLDLGSIYPSAFLHLDEEVTEDSKAPIVLAQCKDCGLVQLKHTVELDSMYRQYWYCSSLNKSMVSSLKEITNEIEAKGYINNYDLTLDLGCNDGTLLNLYTKNIMKVGFDPALNLARPDCLFVNDYFSSEKFFDSMGTSQLKANVITAIAMFYDLPDPVRFVEDVSLVLHKDGVFILQLTDLYSMMKINAFDNLCHEHLEYYKLSDIKSLLKRVNLEIIDVSYNMVNGGSVRVTSAFSGTHPITQNVERYLKEEKEYFETHKNMFTNLKKIIGKTKKHLLAMVDTASKNSSRIFILGASTKGNTLLQLCDITNKLIPFAAEVNKEKFGLRMVGSNIEIISEEEALSMQPGYFLVLPWHFIDSLKEFKKLKAFLESGGKLITPLPEFSIHTNTGIFKL